jgi:fatty acid desaturase
MTTSITSKPDGSATEATFATPVPIDIDSADRERRSSRRKAVFVTSLVALIAAVAVVGLIFPGMLGAAIAIAVFGVLFALELVFRPREQQRDPETFWSL